MRKLFAILLIRLLIGPVFLPAQVGTHITAQNINNVFYTDQFYGADVSIRATACINRVISLGGGTCDASAETGPQTISEEIDVGNSLSAPVLLLVPHSGVWNMSGITDGVSCGIKVFNKSSVIGSSAGGSAAFQITASASVNADSAFCSDLAPVSAGSYVRVDGFMIYSTNGATFVHGALHIQDVFDESLFANMALINTSGIALYVNGACCGVEIRNISAGGNGGTGSQPVYLHGTANHAIFAVSFIGLSADHADPTHNNLIIDGASAAGPISFYNLYSEGVLAGGTNVPFIEITSAWGGVNFYGGMIHPETVGTTAYCIDIASGTSNDVEVQGMRCTGGGDNNAVFDHQRNIQIDSDPTTGIIPNYSTRQLITANELNLGAHLNQVGTNYAGSCAMSSATTCAFSITGAFGSAPLCFPSIDAVSSPPSTAIDAKCSISGTTVTITAGASNSLTWDAMLVGNPN